MPGKVAKKILHDAEKESGRILEEARERADELIREANESAQRIREEAEKKGEDLRKREEERLVTMERLEEKKQLLAMKREILDSIFAQVLEDLKVWKAKRYVDYIVKKIVHVISTGEELVVPGKLHSNTLRKQLAKIKRDRNLKFEVAKEDGDFDFGFIVKRGRIGIRFTGDDIVSELKDRLELDVARRLFAADTDKTT